MKYRVRYAAPVVRELEKMSPDDRMKGAIEDAEDLRALREATRKNAKGRYYTAAEVERRLRSRSARNKRAG